MSIRSTITLIRARFIFVNGEECTWDTIRPNEFTIEWWEKAQDVCPDDATAVMQYFMPCDDRWYTQAELHELTTVEQQLCKR